MSSTGEVYLEWPPSVLDKILGCALEEGHDVLGYMLLSRDLLTICREHKFSKLIVRANMDVSSCINLFAGGDLYKYVKTLTIYGTTPESESCTGDIDDGLIDFDLDSPIAKADYTWMEDLVSLLGALCNVECLFLNDISWGALSLGVRHLIRTTFPGVRRLSLFKVNFWTSNQMALFLQSFCNCNLDELSLVSLYWNVMSHTPRQMASTTPLKLQRLQITSDSSSDVFHDQTMLRWLRGNRTHFAIQKFAIDMPVDMLARIVSTMPALLPSMKEFKLELKNRWWEETLAMERELHGNIVPFDISAYPTLRDQLTDCNSPVLSFELQDDETDKGKRTYPSLAESAQVIRMYQTAKGREAIAAEAAAALQLRQPFTSRVQILTLVVRWSWDSLDLVAVRFVLGLVNEATRRVILACVFDYDNELESFPWEKLDEELCRAPLHMAAPFEFTIMVAFPIGTPAYLLGFEERLPKFVAVADELGIICKFTMVHERSKIQEEEKAEPFFDIEIE